MPIRRRKVDQLQEMKKVPLHLGFHYHIPAISDSNGIYMPGYLGRFVDSIAGHCLSVTCFLHEPLYGEMSRMDYRISSDNVRLVGIGPHTSVLRRTVIWRIRSNYIKQHISEVDILLIRGPSPLLPSCASLASPVPVALLLVGDYLSGVDELPQPIWRKELIRLWSYWNKRKQNSVAQNSLTFVNSRLLYNEMEPKVSNLLEIRTTTLNKSDFFLRRDTCLSKPHRLLYVGRIDRAKGLFQMVEAVSLLIQDGEDVFLNLVGWVDTGDSILEELRILAMELGVEKRICYLGSRPLGPELFECYKEADIFVIASLSSEGFPRVIWEAMAHSLPIVASRVGSIPAFIEGAAELIQPGRADLLVEAIKKLIHCPEVRQEYIVRGRKLARGITLEKQAGVMVRAMELWLEGHRG